MDSEGKREEGNPSKNQNPVKRFRDMGLNDRLMVEVTIGILLIAGVTGWIFLQQASIMQGQLDEMKSSSQQTDRLIILQTGQLTQVAKQAKETNNLARETRRSANIAKDSLDVARHSLETQE